MEHSAKLSNIKLKNYNSPSIREIKMSLSPVQWMDGALN